MQGLSPYTWQTVTNIMNLITGLIAAGLYGNIGLKVLYVEIGQAAFKFPPLTAQRGKLLWVAFTPIYWSVAFIISAAVPQFSFVSSLIGALFILSFTYTAPALLGLVYWVRKDAMTPEERFDPISRTYNHVDHGIKRYMRGFMKKPLFNTWNAIYFLGALVTTTLGVYSSVIGLIGAFAGKSVATSFGCATPV